jgi:hypothetical protein
MTQLGPLLAILSSARFRGEAAHARRRLIVASKERD